VRSAPLYLRLQDAGHEVRVAISEALAQGTGAGLVTQGADWRQSLEWVGRDGIILFEAVSEGFGAVQDDLRRQGYRVVGGSAFGDRLENDRAFAQALLAGIGFPAGHVHEFDRADDALAHIAARPRRYVLKFSGPDFASHDNYVGRLADRRDVAAMLRAGAARPGTRFILMDHIGGIEIGVGAYFDGTHFIEPACLDWEHKRFFAGDMGELTGEMGTVSTFQGTSHFFERTLKLVEPLLCGHGHVGYVNLNTIVNEEGIWPIEFTCRFGYLGYAVLDPLQTTGWDTLFLRMLGAMSSSLETATGWSVGIVVTTPPFPWSRHDLAAPVALPILFDGPAIDGRHIYLGEAGLSDEVLSTSGVYGWTMVVTGVGPTLRDAQSDAYR